MRQFQSNFEEAQRIAAQMREASNTIQSATSHSITKATRTTLSVNSKAQEANQQVLELTKQVSAAFQQAVDTIHSVANEFEKMDSVLQNTFR
ncbi:TIGR04197 family type VII secretion effector [Bacillus cereus]|uniref:TIGR04197 family type VII secretion effector n=1 Tax=Bacillus cereus TaxID=1396 RepID=UPI000C289A85|nr:TIGR04197 family type VII secretion effector [Bacillus cereus]